MATIGRRDGLAAAGAERRTERTYGATYADRVLPVARTLPLRGLAIVLAAVLLSSAAAEGGPGAATSTATSTPTSIPTTSAGAGSSLPFRIEQASGAIPIFVLGPNRFTPQQLSRFIVGVDAFLVSAKSVTDGSQVVYRQEGLRGYIALASSPFVDGPAYLLTLRGEPVRSFEDDAALLDAVSRLGDRLLAAWPGAPSGSGGAGPRAPAGSFPMFLVP